MSDDNFDIEKLEFGKGMLSNFIDKVARFQFFFIHYLAL